MKQKKTAAKKPRAPKKPRAAKTMGASPALRTWLESPARKTVESALERASSPKNTAHRASVAIGRRRLEIRRVGTTYDVIDPTSGDSTPYVKREKRASRPKSPNAETPAQAKRRGLRELEAQYRKDAADKRKRRAKELRGTAQKVRKDRSQALETARAVCKTDREKARATKGPGRRVATAKARTRCAGGALAVEQRFERELSGLRRELEELKKETRGARRRRTSPTPARDTNARERREERDDAITAELERRGLAHLVPIWEAEKDGPALRGLSFDRAIERFLEGVSEREELVQLAQEQAEDAVQQTAQCEQAGYYAEQGDPQASLWHEENCDEDNRPRRRASAAERTVDMFAGLTPRLVEPGPAPRRGKAGRRGPVTARGQQQLGDDWTPLVDAGGPQISLRGAR